MTGLAGGHSGIAAGGGESVIYLLKPVVAFIIAPIDEDGPVIDAWATISPALQALMY
jgi:hypothetical protein